VITERLRGLGCDHFVAVELDQTLSLPGMPFTLYVALGTDVAADPAGSRVGRCSSGSVGREIPTPARGGPRRGPGKVDGNVGCGAHLVDTIAHPLLK